MKMRIAKYKIQIIDGENQTVSGLVSDLFGCHKDEDGYYIVDHLKSGSAITSFIYQKEAREFIGRMEQSVFPSPFEKYDPIKGPEQYSKNAERVRDIIEVTMKEMRKKY